MPRIAHWKHAWSRLRVAAHLSWWFAVVFGLTAGSAPALAATRVHALVIANNQPFRASATAVPSLAPLRYADDDGAAFFEFLQPIVSGAELLAVLDRDTQALYPELGARAQVPSVAGVRQAVLRLAQRMALESKSGHRNVAFVFFSGHGVLDADGKPALALFDAGLTQEFLYREILEQLPADEVHLVIDACHAEAVVRPRDGGVQPVQIDPDQARLFLVQSTLARFPHVGALVAATTDTKAHEWDAIRHGVFSFELLSALRGAADVNRDRRLEYSEVYAFMTAANRAVADSRARLSVVAKPPESNRRAALLNLSEFPRGGLAWLSGLPGVYGLIEVADGRGRHLVTLHGDRESLTDLLVPVGSALYVRVRSAEARVTPRAGQIIPFSSLSFVATGSRERGAMDDALQRGLFMAPYGRSYYEGVIDQNPALIPVDFMQGGAASFWRELPAPSWPALVVGGGLSSAVADVVPLAHGLSLGLRPLGDQGLALSFDAFAARDGKVFEWQAHARAGWLWSIAYGPVRGFGGALAGAGVLAQQVGASSLYSASASAGPVAGVVARINEHVSSWSELQLFGVLHRRDGETVVTPAPAAWLGVALRL